jgi:hypothetical protein
MKISTKPTSLVLVGILFICIFLTPVQAEQQLNGQEQLNKLKEHHLQKSSDLGILKVGADTIYFPWSGRQILSARPNLPDSASASLKREEIMMNSSNSTANVGDLSAINSIKQRDLQYKDPPNGSDQRLANSQEISVSGKGNDKSADTVSKLENSDLHHVENYLSIDVHDISVSAINTMDGGSAVATSNIIIEPVQTIVCPSEVDDKLI